MAYVADHLSVAASEERHEACEDVMSSRHFQTIWLLAKERSTGELAAMTGRGMRAKYGAQPMRPWRPRFARRGENVGPAVNILHSIDRRSGFNQVRPWSVTAIRSQKNDSRKFSVLNLGYWDTRQF